MNDMKHKSELARPNKIFVLRKLHGAIAPTKKKNGNIISPILNVTKTSALRNGFRIIPKQDVLKSKVADVYYPDGRGRGLDVIWLIYLFSNGAESKSGAG